MRIARVTGWSIHLPYVGAATEWRAIGCPQADAPGLGLTLREEALGDPFVDITA